MAQSERASPVRVLMLATYFPPQYSGAAKQAISLAKKLRERGHYIEFVTVRWPGLAEDEVVDGFPVHRVIEGQGNKHKEFRLWWELMKYAWSRRRDFDVFHSHGAYYINSIVGPIAKLLGWKSLVKASLEDNDLHGVGRSATGVVHKLLLQLVDRYIAISANLKDEFHASGLADEKIILLPNGVDTDRFQPAEAEDQIRHREAFNLPVTRPVILTVGVFDQRKNIHWLIEQWVENDAFGTGGLLLAIGPQSRDDPTGEFIGALRQIAKDHPDDVRILEEVQDIERYYCAADLFVLPSHGEGMPNVVLEAMASGVPCITTRVSGAMDLVREGETGFTYVTNDTDSLREALEKAAPKLQGSLGEKGRAMVENKFGLRALAGRYEDLYSEMMLE